MPQRQRIISVVLLILVIVAPTALALGWYRISQDPNLRPLGITEQALRAHDSPWDGAEVVAIVDWVPARSGGFSKAYLAQSLIRSFAAKGVDLRVEFRDGGGVTQITYMVGKTELGPYSTARASEGIAAAVEAYKMR